MKAIAFFISLWAMVTYSIPSAHSSATDDHTQRDAKLEKQLESYISYPELLKQANQGSIVMIRFRVNDEQRITNLEILTDNAELKTSLQQELAGKKLLGNVAEPSQTYLARLRFTMHK